MEIHNRLSQAAFCFNELLFDEIPSDYITYYWYEYSKKRIITRFDRDNILNVCYKIISAEDSTFRNRDVRVAVNPCIRDATLNRRYIKLECAGLKAVCADIYMSRSRYRNPDHTSMNRLDCFKRFPPSLLIQPSPNRLCVFWCLEEFWERTCENAALMDNFLKEFNRIFRERYDGYYVEPVQDLAYAVHVPGTVNRKDPANPFPVRLCSFDGSKIVPNPGYSFTIRLLQHGNSPPITLHENYVDETPIKRYSINEFFDAVGFSPRHDIV